MRMLVVGCGSRDRGALFHDQLVESLRFLGHEVVTLASDQAVDTQRLATTLNRYEPDVLVHVPTAGGPSAAMIREATKASGTVSLCLHRGRACEVAPTRLDDLLVDLHQYDLVAVPDGHTYEAFGGDVLPHLSVVPGAVHLPGLAKVVPSDRRGVVFVGAADPANVDVIAALENLDEVVVVGPGWDEVPLGIHRVEPTSLIELGTVLAGAQLMVELPVSLEHQSAQRCSHHETSLCDEVLIAAAVGTPSIVIARPGVDELLVSGDEVVTCETAEDLVSLVPMLLASADALALVGDAAWDRVTREHSWASRWTTVFDRWVDPHETDADEDVRRVRSDAPAPAAVPSR